MKFTRAAVIAVWTWLAFTGQVCALDDAIIIDSIRSSIVELEISGRSSNGTFQSERATAFVVHSSPALNRTFLFTAAHVLGDDDGWLDSNARKVAVRRVGQNGEFIQIDSDARVEARDVKQDIAVLSVPIMTLSPLSIGSGVAVLDGERTILMGFPSAQRKLVPKISVVRNNDLAEGRVYLEDAAEPGQSGGPIANQWGHIVSIASENIDRTGGRMHRSALASSALKLLNDFLEAKGQPKVVLVVNASSAWSIQHRTGTAAVAIDGEGGEGRINASSDNKPLGMKQVAMAEGSGTERSGCVEDFGRRLSAGRARANLSLFESSGIRMWVDLYAQAGQFIEAKDCLGGRPLNLKSVSNAVLARADISSEIGVAVVVAPLQLRLVWRDVPKGTRIDIKDPSGGQYAEFEVENSGEKSVPLNKTGAWKVSLASTFLLATSKLGDASMLQNKSIFYVEGNAP